MRLIDEYASSSERALSRALSSINSSVLNAWGNTGAGAGAEACVVVVVGLDFDVSASAAKSPLTDKKISTISHSPIVHLRLGTPTYGFAFSFCTFRNAGQGRVVLIEIDPVVDRIQRSRL